MLRGADHHRPESRCPAGSPDWCQVQAGFQPQMVHRNRQDIIRRCCRETPGPAPSAIPRKIEYGASNRPSHCRKCAGQFCGRLRFRGLRCEEAFGSAWLLASKNQAWTSTSMSVLSKVAAMLGIQPSAKMRSPSRARRDGRVAEGTRLESAHTRKGIGGSNPSLSAIFPSESTRIPT